MDKIIEATTPRRTLFFAGLVFIGLGIAGFVFGWSNADAIALPLGKRIGYIALGLFLEWVAEIWTTDWKRPVAAVLGIALLALGVASFVGSDLGFMSASRPWEGGLYIAIAVLQFVALWWPRRFYDYEWGTGWSSGLRWASKPDPYQDGRVETGQR